MTRTSTLFAVALLAFGLPGSESHAEPAPVSPELTTFLASLQGPPPVDSVSTLGFCQVTLTCDAVPQFGSISCSSSSGDCHSGSTWVECDGVRTDCPVCYIQCPCPPETNCFGWSSCTHAFAPRRIICDGQAHYCDPPQSCAY